MKYQYSESLQVLAEDIARRLFPHIETSRIKCYRVSEKGARVIARCHALNSVMQKALDVKPLYVFEFIEEKFNDRTTEQKVKIVLRQLLSISERFDGRFRDNAQSNSDDVDAAYQMYLDCRRDNKKVNWFSLHLSS